MVVDLVTINLALAATLALREIGAFSWQMLVEAPSYFLLISALWGIWASFFDGYDVTRTADASQSSWSAARAAFCASLCYLAIPFLTPHLPVSRLSSYLFVGLTTVSVSAWRVAYAVVFSQPLFQQAVIIVGTGASGETMAHALDKRPRFGNPYSGSGYKLLGFVEKDSLGTGLTDVAAPVLGGYEDLPCLVQREDVTLIALAVENGQKADADLYRSLLACRETGVTIESVASLYERLTGKVMLEETDLDFTVLTSVQDSPWYRLLQAGKRASDILFGFLGLVGLCIVAPFVALANALSSPGPLFYRQVRVGKAGVAFTILKFRSMVPSAEESCGAVWAGEDDCRITPVGKFLRKTRLDELPQVWNILKGEMTLIGPRPERPEFVEELMGAVPFYQARHAVRPGLTGWAQVRYRYGSSVEDALAKLQYDLYYIRHQSLYLELSILAKTAAVVVGLQGR
jgi:exopolysaccharide biosynthesis polyprenyl glycosylphosphotransferase